jgi:putative addiction module component (TIGR02574 family)
MKLQEVRESALALPRRSREKLLNELRQSLDDEKHPACPPGVLSDRNPNFMKIIEARLDAYDRGEDKGIPWEKVRAEMEARIHARKVSRRRKI